VGSYGRVHGMAGRVTTGWGLSGRVGQGWVKQTRAGKGSVSPAWWGRAGQGETTKGALGGQGACRVATSRSGPFCPQNLTPISLLELQCPIYPRTPHVVTLLELQCCICPRTPHVVTPYPTMPDILYARGHHPVTPKIISPMQPQ